VFILQKKQIQKYSLSALPKMMTEDGYEKSVIEKALEHFKRSPGHLSNEAREMREAMKKYLRIPKFPKKPWEEFTFNLIQPLQKVWNKNNELTALMLAFWMDANQELVKSVQNFLATENIPALPDNCSWRNGHLNFLYINTEFEDLKENYINTPGAICNEFDVLLVLTLLLDGIYVDNKVYEETPEFIEPNSVTRDESSIPQKENNSKKVSSGEEGVPENSLPDIGIQIISMLQGVSPNSQIWSESNEYLLIETIQKIVGQKRAEYAKSMDYESLSRKFSIFQSKNSWGINFFRFQQIKNWKPESVEIGQIPFAQNLLEDLQRNLESYEAIHDQPTGSFSEDLEKSELGKKIIGLEKELSTLFGFIEVAVTPPTEKKNPETESLEIKAEKIIPVNPVEILAADVVETQPETKDKETTPSAISDPAIRLISEGTNKNIDNFNQQIIDAIIHMDYSKAYWLEWAVEKEGQKPIIPSWLLKSIQSSWWLWKLWPKQSPNIVTEGFEGLTDNQSELLENTKLKQIAAIAALYPALADSQPSAWTDWLPNKREALQQFGEMIEVQKVIDNIRAFSEIGYPISPRNFVGAQSIEQINERIKSISKNAKEWLKTADHKTTKYSRATSIWRKMIHQKDGVINPWLNFVVFDQRDQFEFVKDTLNIWGKHEGVNRIIDELDQPLGRKSNQVEGRARHALIEWVDDAVEMAFQWLQLVEQHKKFEEKQLDWVAEQQRHLTASLQTALPQALKELERELPFLDKGNDFYRAVSLILLHSFFSQMTTSLLGEDGLTRNESDGIFIQPEMLLSNPLEAGLAYRLVFYPDTSIDDDFTPLNPYNIRKTLSEADRLNTYETINNMIIKRDYRFMSELICQIKIDEQKEWESTIQESLKSHLEKMAESIDQADVKIERLMVEGLISTGDRAKYSSKIQNLNRELSLIQRAQSGNLGPVFDSISNIIDELEVKRSGKIESSKRLWDSLKKEAQRLWGSDVEKISQKIDRYISQNDVRLLNDYLSNLRTKITSHSSIEEIIKPEQPIRDILAEYKDKHGQIVDFLKLEYATYSGARALLQISDKLKNKKNLPWFSNKHLPQDRFNIASKAVRAWYELKHTAGDISFKTDTLSDYVLDIVKYIGFNPQGPSPISTQNYDYHGYFQRWSVMAKSITRPPVPEFGSRLQGKLNIIGVWERPQLDVISEFMQSIGSDVPFIVLYFGTLPKYERELLPYTTRKNDLPILVLDESVLLFLAEEYESRLDAFFQVTLPSSSVHPYSRSGYVPQEMFFGRDRDLRDVMRMNGPSIVFGGRQLGKTALLKRAEEEFNKRSEEGYHAVYIHIKSVGEREARFDSGNYQTIFWREVGGALANLNIIDKKLLQQGHPEKISNALVKVINEKDLHILLLLDEADKFLEADSEREFLEVNRLKELTIQSSTRFKPVLAGLHNVQRFTRKNNHPLVGGNLVIGPLDSQAAIELIRDPLCAMGYRFQTEDEILRVLSYTNRHTGLLQLFGEELTAHMSKKVENMRGSPPFTITREDIESVYAKPDVRQEITNRFIWTLNLDKRYEVIALSMVYDQWESESGFGYEYEKHDLYNLVAEIWAEGFRDIAPDTFGGYLDEMVGLGVLSPIGTRYCLRNPNLAPLLGTFEDIQKDLYAAIGTPAPEKNAFRSHHARLSKNDHEYSPLTLQEESLIHEKSGVMLFIGSEANCYGLLKTAIRTIFIEDQNAIWHEAQAFGEEGKSLEQELKKLISRSISESKLKYFYHEIESDLSGEVIRGQIETALEICANAKSHLRVIFAMNPSSAWAWYQLPTVNRTAIEKRISVISIQKWDNESIRHSLELNTKIATADFCKKIQEVTGGWGVLVKTILEYIPGDNTQKGIAKFQEMYNSSQEWKDFLNRAGIINGMSYDLIDALIQSLSNDNEVIKENDVKVIASLFPNLKNYSELQLQNSIEYLKSMRVISQVNEIKSAFPVEHYLRIDQVVKKAMQMSK
jgi:hypothetical protein